VAASQLLHFYYDGFIWRVREPATGAVLGVASSSSRRAPAWLGPGLRHALLWGLLVVPCLGLWYGETHAGAAPAQRRLDVAALVPDNALLRFDAAEIAWERGDREAGLDGFRAVLALDPAHAGARRNLALSLCELGDQAYRDGDRAAVRRAGTELLQLEDGLAEADRGFVEGKLAVWRDMPAPR
jgi:tetratricopeptide (TPR) repeat protein